MVEKLTESNRFSVPIKINSGVCKFSPNGQFLASALSTCLDIYDLKKSEIVKRYNCLDLIELVEWSPDSHYVFCGMLKRKTIQAWSLVEANWICKIDEGSLGFTNAFWSPDGRHILTVAEIYLRITLWSLVSKSVFYINYVKPGSKSYGFSPNGVYMAVVERRNCQDYISVFACTTWKLLTNFITDTQDLQEISWSPDSCVICVVESYAQSYKVLFYSINGKLKSSYSTESQGLGLRSLAWSYTGQFIAIGGYNEKVQLLNSITWTPIFEYFHPSSIASSEVTVYKSLERKLNQEWFQESECFSRWGRYEAVEERPLQIPAVEIDVHDPKFSSKLGVRNLHFSKCGHYLASINGSMPTVVWIWDMKKHSISDVVIQSQNAISIAWNPRSCVLAICTGTNIIYVWSPDHCMMLKAPFEEPIAITEICWHPLENILLVIGSGKMSLLYLSS